MQGVIRNLMFELASFQRWQMNETSAINYCNVFDSRKAQCKISGGSGGGGLNRPRQPPPPFFPPFFFFFFAFHPRGRSGRRTVPPPHNVNVATNKNQGGNVPDSPPPPPAPAQWPFSCRPGAASRHLDSRPSLFTNPGSATENGDWPECSRAEGVENVLSVSAELIKNPMIGVIIHCALILIRKALYKTSYHYWLLSLTAKAVISKWLYISQIGTVLPIQWPVQTSKSLIVCYHYHFRDNIRFQLTVEHSAILHFVLHSVWRLAKLFTGGIWGKRGALCPPFVFFKEYIQELFIWIPFLGQ